MADICPVGSPENELWIATNLLFRKERQFRLLIIPFILNGHTVRLLIASQEEKK